MSRPLLLLSSLGFLVHAEAQGSTTRPLRAQCSTLLQGVADKGLSNMEVAAYCRGAFPPELCRSLRSSLGGLPWNTKRIESTCMSMQQHVLSQLAHQPPERRATSYDKLQANLENSTLNKSVIGYEMPKKSDGKLDVDEAVANKTMPNSNISQAYKQYFANKQYFAKEEGAGNESASSAGATNSSGAVKTAGPSSVATTVMPQGAKQTTSVPALASPAHGPSEHTGGAAARQEAAPAPWAKSVTQLAATNVTSSVKQGASAAATPLFATNVTSSVKQGAAAATTAAVATSKGPAANVTSSMKQDAAAAAAPLFATNVTSSVKQGAAAATTAAVATSKAAPVEPQRLWSQVRIPRTTSGIAATAVVGFALVGFTVVGVTSRLVSAGNRIRAGRGRSRDWRISREWRQLPDSAEPWETDSELLPAE